MEKVETQLALVSKEFPVFNLMQLKTGWTLVHEDPISGLFVRERSPLAEKIRITKEADLSHAGAGLCYP